MERGYRTAAAQRSSRGAAIAEKGPCERRRRPGQWENQFQQLRRRGGGRERDKEVERYWRVIKVTRWKTGCQVQGCPVAGAGGWAVLLLVSTVQGCASAAASSSAA